MASTRESTTASCTKRVTTSNDWYGWCTRTSSARMAVHTSGAPSKAATGTGQERAVLEPRHVDGGIELEEVGERDEAFGLVEIAGGQLELLHQCALDVGRQIALVLKGTVVPICRSRRLCSMEIRRS